MNVPGWQVDSPKTKGGRIVNQGEFEIGPDHRCLAFWLYFQLVSLLPICIYLPIKL